jgi:hypothetical protein
MSQAGAEVVKNTKHDHRLATALVVRFSFGFGLVPSRDPAGGTSYFPHKKKKVKKRRTSPLRNRKSNSELRSPAGSERSEVS